MMATPLKDPKDYASWKGKDRAYGDWENYQTLHDRAAHATGKAGTTLPAREHGPAPKTMGDPEEVNNPTQGEQAAIHAPSQESKTWPPSKAAQRGEE